MTKPVPIKTDLFRFITFRSPEQITYQDKVVRFVTHPDFQRSYFNACPVPDPKSGANVFEDFLNQFEALKTVEQIREVNVGLFDYSNLVFKRKLSIKDILNNKENDKYKLTEEQILTLFDQLIYQVITKQSNYVRQAITQMLIVNHIINKGNDLIILGITKVNQVKIEIPKQVLECFKRWQFKDCNGNLEGVQNLGIADFRKVEQEVCCYMPGEVSHIENVMAKEYKERTTRNYLRTENTIETSRETETEKLSDLTTTTRNELATEISSVLEQDQSSNYGGSLGVQLGGAKYHIDINAFADFSNASSSSYSNSEAKTYAEEVTKRALERIVQKTSEKRTSKIIKEFEENNKHGFDNRGDNATNITGVYRWIDVLYKNRLVNFGKRLMVEFMVPEPAKFYKRILQYKEIAVEENTTIQENIEQEKPKTLAELGINSPEDITRDNYNVIAQNYGIVLDAPLDQFKTKNQSILPPCPPNSDNSAKTFNQTIIIEPFYETDSVSGKVDINYTWHKVGGGSSPAFKMDIGYFNVTIGSFSRGSSVNKTVNFGTILSTKYTNSIDVNFDYKKMNSITATIELKCKLTLAKFQEWQNISYQKLLDAYNTALANFNNTLEPEETLVDVLVTEQKSTNPAMNRIIEQRELKRICIEMLMKPYCRTQGMENFNEINACDLYEIPQVNQTKELSEYAKQVKFFEQAIDWQIMSYLFYPYYWADKCDWATLMQSENDDVIFQAFLQSGMSRVVVPIRQQFTEAFAYYLETGDIWISNDLVAGTENDVYLSIAEEMQNITEQTVEQEWETRVPTSLAIIQGKSAYLNQEGLPCCTAVENSETTSAVQVSTDVLQLLNP